MGGLRNSGIEILGNVPWGTHLCAFYQSEEDLLNILVPYFRNGLEENEKCIWVSTGASSKERAMEAFKKGCPWAQAHMASGRIEFYSHDEWYLKDGTFEKERVFRQWAGKLESAVSEGFDGLRITGDTLWVTDALWRSFSEYEGEVDREIGGMKMLALCTYPLGSCGASELMGVVANHGFAMAMNEGGWRLLETQEHSLIEEALRRSEERYRKITELASDYIFHIKSGQTGVFLEWISENFTRVSGYSLEEIRYPEQWEEVIYPEDVDIFKRNFNSALHGETVKCEYRCVRKSGEVCWLLVRMAPEFDGEGKVTGVDGAAKDITERKQAEEALERSKASLEAAQRIARLGNWVWDFGDEKGYWSRELYSILGLDPEKADLTYGAFLDAIHPEDRDRVYENIKEAVRNDRPYSIDHRVVLPDGTVRIVHQQAGADLSPRGGPPRIIGTIQDITERKALEYELLKAREELEEKIRERTSELLAINARLMEEVAERKRMGEALKEQTRLLRAFFENTLTPLVFLDREFNFIMVSDSYARACHRETSEFEGKNHFHLYPHEENEAIFRSVVETKRPYFAVAKAFEYPDHPEWGVTYWDWSLVPILDSKGEVEFLVFSLEDVTAAKKAETEKDEMRSKLFQSQKMEAIGKLAGGIAHDFNNLMVIAKLNSSLALKELPADTGGVRGYIEAIAEASERAANLTRQLLIFSRQQPSEPVYLDLNEKVRGTVRMLKRLIGENIVIETELAEDLWTVKADMANIEQLITNLLINAKEAMPNGGKVSIKTGNVAITADNCKCSKLSCQNGDYACLAIEDTGVGMDAEVIDRAFEPFYSTKGAGAGTGLGLTVVQNIVKEHGGCIILESSPGHGTVFKVYLPAFRQAIMEAARKEAVAACPLKGGTVLLVEDERTLRRSVALVLAKNGFRVTQAQSVREAREAFLKEGGNFDLVFTDVVLNDGNGTDLVEEFRVNAPGLKVLFASGYMDIENQWPAIKERGYGFLQKPFEIDTLMAAVKNALEKAPEA